MNNAKQLVNKIVKDFYNNNFSLMAQKINQLFKSTYTEDTYFFNLIYNVDLEGKDKLLFFLKIVDNDKIKLETLKDKFSYKYIIKYINENTENIINWIEDKNFENEFIIWLKKYKYIDRIEGDILTKILKIPQIQKSILLDLELFKQNYSLNFYKALPQEFGFLISFYVDYDLDEYTKDLEKLYNKFFSDNLDKVGKLLFIKEQINLSQKDDIFNLGYLNCYYELSYLCYALKKISENKEYYEVIKRVIKLTNLSLEEILKFFYKYEDALFFKNIIAKTTFNNDIIEKIKYLSFENRIIDYRNIEDLDNISLEDLKKYSNEKNDHVKLQIFGGPTGSTRKKFFQDGYDTEVRIIKYDGSVVSLDAKEGHVLVIEKVYSNINYDQPCIMAGEIAALAARQLSCITLIIENESCLIIANKDISDEQIESLKNLKLVDKDNAKFGIFEVNEENNDLIPVYLEDVDFYKMIEYMESLNKKIKL